MTEQTFKRILDSLWYCFTSAAGLVDTLRSVGLSLTSAEPGELGFNSLLDIQEKVATVMALVGTYINALGFDTEKRLRFNEDFMQFLYDVRTAYPECSGVDGFPEEYYPPLLKMFTDAGFTLPWTNQETSERNLFVA